MKCYKRGKLYGLIVVYSLFILISAKPDIVASAHRTIQFQVKKESVNSFITTKCPNNYCLFLPVIMALVPEVDIPQCRWSFAPGSIIYLSYAWGSNLQTTGSLWRNAFESGLSQWNMASTRFWYYYNSTSSNIINTYYDETSNNRGITYLRCLGDTTLDVRIEGNVFYDTQEQYSVEQRRGIATHELGHGYSIGHIPNEYPQISLMFEHNPLDFFSTTYNPQSSDIALVNQIYP